MNTSNQFVHLATPSWLPFLSLADNPCASITARAPLRWLLDSENFQDWGSSMYVYGSTRSILMAGGLPGAGTSYKSLKSTEPRWLDMLRCLSQGLVCPETSLSAARLFLYLGFYEDAIKVIHSTPALAEIPRGSTWAEGILLIASDCLGLPNHHADKLEMQLLKTEIGASSPLSFHLVMKLISIYCRAKRNKDAERWLEIAKLLMRELQVKSGPRVGGLAEALWMRQFAGLCICRDKFPEAREALRGGYECLGTIPNGSNIVGLDFLILEAARRLLAFWCMMELRLNNSRAALDIALKLYVLDPNCPHANTLASEAADTAGCNDLSIRFAMTASYTGVLERPYSVLRRLKQSRVGAVGVMPLCMELIDSDIFGCEDAVLHVQEAVSHGGIFPPSLNEWIDSKKYTAKSNRKLALPILLDEVKNLSLNLLETKVSTKQTIRQSEVYARFETFWTLSDPIEDSPFFSKLPSRALAVLRNRPVPWYQTLYTQHTLKSTMRDQIIAGALNGTVPHDEEVVFGATVDSLAGASSNIDFLIDEVRSVSVDSDPLVVASVCRVLAYLGFHSDAKRCGEMICLPEILSPEDAYLAYTHCFVSNLLDTSMDFASEVRRLFHRVVDSDEAQRLRLNLVIMGGVHEARKGIAPVWWRAVGESILNRIKAIPQFSEFEKSLLSSRFLRFASYVSFLNKDSHALKVDVTRFEQLAREAPAKTDQELIFKSENLYAVLESRARAELYLGHLNVARDLIEEAAREVDPFDSRLWCQVGEYRWRTGDFYDALVAYERSAMLGPPFRMIAWQRAGECYEKLSDVRAAAECYIRSLRCYPKGRTPLERLEAMQSKLDDPYIESWIQHYRICRGQ